MASVRKKRTSAFWFACFTRPNGKRAQISTKTTDHKQALKIAWAYEEAVRKKATVEQMRKTISALSQEIHGTALSNKSCADYFDSWIDRRRSEVSAGSIRRFNTAKQSLSDHLKSTWFHPLSELTTADLSAWRNDLANTFAPATVNINLKIIKQALQDAWHDGLISESPADKIKLLRIPKDGAEKRIFTQDQYNLLLDHAKGEWPGIIRFGAFTGQRLSDISCAKVADISGGWWRFISRKTKANMDIPLARPVLEWLENHLKTRKIASEYVFPDAAKIVASKDGIEGQVSMLSNQFYDLMARVGLVPSRNRGKRREENDKRRARSEISFHSFRHTCTTWLKSQGVSESVAMAFVGHESKAVNRSYTHLPESTLSDAMKKMETFSTAA